MATKTESKSTAGRQSRASAGGRGSSSSKTTTDHSKIMEWVNDRKGKPASVKDTGTGKDDVGILRIDFPGYAGEETLQEITWDQFFKQFDDNDLAFLYQEKTSSGKESHFNKIVSHKKVT